MESIQPQLPIDEPQAGSVRLTNGKRETYCQRRMLGILPVMAAREAGFTAGTASAASDRDKTAGLRGIASKLERNKKIQDRIRYLSGNTEAVLREKRRRIEECLWNIADAPVKRVMSTSPAVHDDDGKEIRAAAVALDTDKIAGLDDVERESLFGTIKAVTFFSGGAVKLEPYSVTEATAQLRAMNGLDAPKQVDLKHDAGDALTALLQAVDGATRGIPNGA